MDTFILFYLIALILSIVLHEVSHGYAANALGDPTARMMGRLTINPLRHIDPVGSVILPGILILTQSPFLFGWAKPVPFNPYNLRAGKWGEAIVAAAGPFVNFLIALTFGLMIRFSGVIGFSGTFLSLISIVVYMNLLLMMFNLLPIPPLDGSKILKAVLPNRLGYSYGRIEERLFMMGPFAAFGVVFILAYVLWPFVTTLIRALYFLITGVAFF